MPVSFPMSTAGFLDALPVKSVEFDLPEAVETSRTSGGEVLTNDGMSFKFLQTLR